MQSTQSSNTSVFVTGTFNGIHPGHIQLIEFASKFGPVTVGINGDTYVKQKYGDRALPLLHRAYMLKSLRYVQNVIVFNEDTPSKLLSIYRPTFYVKGPDYKNVELPEQAILIEHNIKLIIHPGEKIYHAHQLIQNWDDSWFQQP